MSSSNRDIKYVCGNCGQTKTKATLTVKRVQFLEMGENGKLLKTRVVEWLCEDCRAEDPAWSQDKLFGSPGLQDVMGKKGKS